MKVLLYNWVPFDDMKLRGGGVTVYLKNILEKLTGPSGDMEITFLSSGSYYDIYNKDIRYESIDNIYHDQCKSFSIINSPIFSPAYLSFTELDQVLYDEKLKEVFSIFLGREGPFDVVHFHNLEGLSIKILECKNLFPGTKFIYTLHNYYAICPQVNLWKEESCNCTMSDTGEECIKCMRQHVPREKLRHKMAMTYYLKKHPSEILEKAYQKCGKRLDDYYLEYERRTIDLIEKEKIVDALQVYRRTVVSYLNCYMDSIIAVSKRVKDIAVNTGMEQGKVTVVYIGTKAAETAMHKSNCSYDGTKLSIIYMGYRRYDKGYYFLTEVLNKLDSAIAGKIEVTLAAKKVSDYPDVSVETEKFVSFTIQDGYTREEIPILLKGKHLGIVPVLWEDNLPQAAIEMVAHGVPILASNRGGASELAADNRFCFKAANVEDCINKITFFLENPQELESYWNTYTGLKTIKEHIDELARIYSEETL